MAAAADGDRSAVAPLFALLWPLVRGFTRHALRDAPDAEDAAQDTLLKIFERVHQFDPARGDAVTWALTLCRFEVRTQLRRTFRRREDALTVDGEASQPRPDEALMEKHLADAVMASLGTLSDDDARAILTRVLETEADGASPATIRKRWQRAVGRLRLALGAGHGI